MWFQKKRSTLTVAEALIKEIQVELERKGGKMYVVFVDYSKAFDTTNRQILIRKLEMMIGNTRMLKLISNIIAENYVQISNGIDKSKWISQTNGVLQGDPLSPLLLNVLEWKK